MTLATIKEQISIMEEKEQQLLSADTINVDELNIVRNRLSELRMELEQQNEQNTTEIEPTRTPFEFAQKFNFDEYAGTKGNLLNSIVQSFLNSKAKAVAELYEQQIAILKDELQGETEQRINLQYQNQQHQGNIQLLSESNLAITEEKNRYKLEAEDYKSRFEAAAAVIVEKDAEIERLKQREADLQEQIARAPSPTARTIVDVDSIAFDDVDALIQKAREKQAEEERKKEAERLASRPKITNVRWEDDIRQQWYLAELVGDCEEGRDGKTIRINRLNINLYQQMDQEEAARFRAEQSNQQSIEQSQSSIEIPTAHSPLVSDEVARLPEDFRPGENSNCENETNVSWSGDTSDHSGVAVQTLEERVKALEVAVFGQVKDVA